MTHQPVLNVFPDIAALHQFAAERLVQLANERVAAVGSFLLVLAGGNTPRGLYQRLAQSPFREQMPWEHMRLFWSDERYVPYDSPDSNYLMVREALLNHVSVPMAHVYPAPTNPDNPADAAAAYHSQLQHLIESHDGQLDVVLLGMGADGHTASLFPHSAALSAPASQLVVAVQDAPKPPPHRLTLTPAAINKAAHVFFIVTGADKAEALQAVLHRTHDPHGLPAQLVHPAHGSVTWLVDQAAAGQEKSAQA